MKTLSQFKKQAFKKEGVKKTYKDLQPEFKLIKQIILTRSEKGITQRDLANKIGITQSALARFESGKVNPTLSFVQKITNGLGLELMIK